MSERRAIRPPGTPAHMSQAVQVGQLVFVSGQIAFDASGALAGPDDVAAQARQCFANIEAILAEVGGALTDVAKLTAFLASPDLAPAYLAVRAETFPVDPPATTTVVAATLVPGFLIEIEATAVLPGG